MPRTYYNEEFLMAKFSEYAYFDPSELASTIFGDRKGYTSPETGTVWDFDPANVFKTGGLGSQCYVFTCRSENDIAVVFRGTVPDQWADLKADARLLLGQAVQWPGQTQALVSAALLNPWQAIKAQVIGKLTDLIQSRQPMGSCRVIVTGHSLGAMLATIAG
jgi:hypothetical protein